MKIWFTSTGWAITQEGNFVNTAGFTEDLWANTWLLASCKWLLALHWCDMICKNLLVFEKSLHFPWLNLWIPLICQYSQSHFPQICCGHDLNESTGFYQVTLTGRTWKSHYTSDVRWGSWLVRHWLFQSQIYKYHILTLIEILFQKAFIVWCFDSF